jgi:hypothetical protein
MEELIQIRRNIANRIRHIINIDKLIEYMEVELEWLKANKKSFEK